MTQNTVRLKPGLYVTATPIGNLGDITYRAVAALKAADLILCEDTRHTARLCGAYDIRTERAPYHDHNGARVRPGIIEKLKNGAIICLVSDAGTPLISDPGYKLVRDARDAGIDVFPVPGANAAIAALSAAGMPSNEFHFAGFPPAKQAARREFLERLRTIQATLIFYESASRLADSLGDMATVFGDRRATVARELTKTFEEFRAGLLSDLTEKYGEAAPKGEIVVIVEGATAQAFTQADIDVFLGEALSTLSVRDAAAQAAEQFGINRKAAYARALELKNTK